MEKSFEDIIDKQLSIGVPIVGFLISFGLLFFILTDLGFPEAPFQKLLEFRIGMALIILIFTLLCFTKWGKKHWNIRILAFILLFLCGFSVSWLTMMTGGSQSPYWTMIILTFFGGTLILRLMVWEAFVLYASILGIYVWVILGVAKEPFFSPYFFTSVFGITLAMVVSLAGNWYIFYLEKTRYESQKSEWEKTRELNQQIKLAGEIQQTLLPSKIENPLAEFMYLYKPCMAIGGDLIDCRQLDEKTIGLIICDVSGHGVPAALISSMIKITLAQWPVYNQSPSKFLHYLYYELCPILYKHFVTAMVIHVNLYTGESKLSSAGHLAAYMRTKEEKIIPLNSKGSMICSLLPPNYKDLLFYLGTEDTLFLYTDGITEIHNPNREMFEEERLEKFILEEGKNFENLGERLLTILQKFRGYSGDDFPDDISLIGFRRKKDQNFLEQLTERSPLITIA